MLDPSEFCIEQEFSPITEFSTKVAVIILGGGQGKRLFPLTADRCKPVVSFGGRYSLIDIPISHAFASGLDQIFVIGQHLAPSLHDHLIEAYERHGSKKIHFLTPQKNQLYEGTADAIRKNLSIFEKLQVDYFLILSGDQLYNINFQKMLEFAIESDASMVIAAQKISEKEAKRMGLLRLEEGGTRLVDFIEKPQEQKVLDAFALDGSKNYLGSMGIYIFKKKALLQLLTEDHRADFGMHLITTEMKKKNVHAYCYTGYWEDIGTIQSYYAANLALTKDNLRQGLDCYDQSKQIVTKSYHLPGARVLNCLTNASLLCEGSIIEADEVTNCIIGVRTKIGPGSHIKDSILMGNTYYGQKDSGPLIGSGVVICHSIIDENARIGNQVVLMNQKGYQHYDHPSGLLFVRDGITIVPNRTTLPDNFIF